eukprot:5644795-Pyramimonas_sp.AAC.1
MEKSRLRALGQRRRRMWKLRDTVHEKIGLLWRTGIPPSVGHGTGVSGTSDSALKQLRAVAGGMIGASGNSSLTHYLSTQCDEKFGPIFDCTTILVKRYCGFIWGNRVSIADLHHALEDFRARLQAATRPTWKIARGPIAAVFLALQRIGWSMLSPIFLQDDVGQKNNLLQTAPRDLERRLCDSICRWQMLRIREHLPERTGDEKVWRRAMRAAVLRVPPGPQRGALRRLWTGGLLCPDKAVDLGISDSRECHYCGAPHGSLSHQWNCCEVLMQSSDVLPEAVPEERMEEWDRRRM